MFVTARHLAALLAPLLVSACAVSQGRDSIDISALAQVPPKDFQLVADLPQGLSTTGRAFLMWGLVSPDGQQTDPVTIELTARPGKVGDPVVFTLPDSAVKSFQDQQIKLRAQLLAGFYGIRVYAVPDFCDVAGIAVHGGDVSTVLRNAATGQDITRIDAGMTAKQIESHAPYCV